MPNPGTRRQWVLAVLDRYEAPLVAMPRGFWAMEIRPGRRCSMPFCSFASGRRRSSRPRGPLAVSGLPQQGPGFDPPAAAANRRQRGRPGRARRPRARPGRTGRAAGPLRRVGPAGGPTARRASARPLIFGAKGFPIAQISEIAGQSEGNVRVLVHRAIKQLRQCLKVTSISRPPMPVYGRC